MDTRILLPVNISESRILVFRPDPPEGRGFSFQIFFFALLQVRILFHGKPNQVFPARGVSCRIPYHREWHSRRAFFSINSFANFFPLSSSLLHTQTHNRFFSSLYRYRFSTGNPWPHEGHRTRLAKELIEKNARLECHFLDGMESYRKLLVFGREDLIGLLLKEDPDLQKSEKKDLKRNPAFRWIRAENEDPGFIIFTGNKIRVSMPLRFPEVRGTVLSSREEKPGG